MFKGINKGLLNMLKQFTGCLLMVLFSTSALAQVDDCEVTLNHATDEYNAGHFYGIDSLLSGCMNRGFSREQRQRAYLLLTHIYLLLDNPTMAEESYLNLLKANPEFQTDVARDPIEVVYLSKKFTSAPIFSLYGKIGGNTSFVGNIHELSITGEPISTKYSLRAGWNASVGGEYHITESFSAGVEAEYSFTSYGSTQSNLWGTSQGEIIDRQNWIRLPLYGKYTHLGKKINPYAYAGFSLNFLVSDRANPSLFSRASADSEQVTPSESPILNYGFNRTFFSKSLFVGGGLQYKWGLAYLFADVRYSFGLDNLIEYKYLDDSELEEHSEYTFLPLWTLASLDNFFRINNLFVTIGYRHPLYNPRKLKNAKTKSVLRDIEKQKDAE
jgi:hypothetical protein